jgi:signal transduction histidine kinase
MGFDVERAKVERGMGLVSMEERVHLVHGIFTIESAVNSGTKIAVRVPLAAETKASTTIAESA